MTLTITPPTSDFQPQISTTSDTPAYPGLSGGDTDTSRDLTPPDYSPITPKSFPAVLAISDHATASIVDPTTKAEQGNGETSTAAAIAATEYVPQPPAQPFSGDDSIDGLALRAAISSLQFQRQRAKDDIRALQQAKAIAQRDPESFAQDLVAGKLKEKRRQFGSTEDVIDGQNMADSNGEHADAGEISLPGPQNVVRMPNINWDKYNVMGEPLEALHEQQRRWPGCTPFQANKGREFSVTAPYSPFHDSLDGQPTHTRNPSDGSRKDSAPTSAAETPVTGDHSYETRRNSKDPAQ